MQKTEVVSDDSDRYSKDYQNSHSNVFNCLNPIYLPC